MNQQEKTALAEHVQGAGKAIAEMHLAHHRGARLLDLFTDHVTAILGRPMFLFAVAIFAGLWILVAERGAGFGIHIHDDYPIPLLDLIVTIAATVIANLILASQRRADRLGLPPESGMDWLTLSKPEIQLLTPLAKARWSQRRSGKMARRCTPDA